MAEPYLPIVGSIRILMAGGDADLANTNNAIARFNKKFPNFQVSVDMDPISTGWGDYVTKVIGEFAANNQHDIFGTAIETFQTFASRGLLEPIDDFVAKNPNYSDFAPALFEDCKYQGKTYFVPTSWNNIMINYNRDHFDKAGIAYPKSRLDLGRVPRDRQEADDQGLVGHRHAVGL